MGNKEINKRIVEFEESSKNLLEVVKNELIKIESIKNENKIRKIKNLKLNSLDISFKKDKEKAYIFLRMLGKETFLNINVECLTGFYKEKRDDSYMVFDNKFIDYKKFDKGLLLKSLTSFINELYDNDVKYNNLNLNTNNHNLYIYNGLIEHIKNLGFQIDLISEDLRKQISFYTDELDNIKNKLIKKASVVVNEFEDVLKTNFETLEKEKLKQLVNNPDYIYDCLSIVNGIKEFNEMAFKYTPKVPTIEDLKNRLLINNYLKAGYLLEYNRMFMEEGADKAKEAVVVLSSEKDKNNSNKKELEEIIESIEKVIDDYDYDGRVFRDMIFNYDFIYNMTDIYGDYYIRYIPYIKKLINLEYKYRNI